MSARRFQLSDEHKAYVDEQIDAPSFFDKGIHQIVEDVVNQVLDSLDLTPEEIQALAPGSDDVLHPR